MSTSTAYGSTMTGAFQGDNGFNATTIFANLQQLGPQYSYNSRGEHFTYYSNNNQFYNTTTNQQTATNQNQNQLNYTPGDKRTIAYDFDMKWTTNKDYMTDWDRQAPLKIHINRALRFGANYNINNIDPVSSALGTTNSIYNYYNPRWCTNITSDEVSMDLKEMNKSYYNCYLQVAPDYQYTGLSNYQLSNPGASATPTGSLYGFNSNFKSYWGLTPSSIQNSFATGTYYTSVDDDIKMGLKTFIDSRVNKICLALQNNIGLAPISGLTNYGSGIGIQAILDSLTSYLKTTFGTPTDQGSNSFHSRFTNITNAITFINPILGNYTDTYNASNTNNSILANLNYIRTNLNTTNSNNTGSTNNTAVPTYLTNSLLGIYTDTYTPNMNNSYYGYFNNLTTIGNNNATSLANLTTLGNNTNTSLSTLNTSASVNSTKLTGLQNIIGNYTDTYNSNATNNSIIAYLNKISNTSSVNSGNATNIGSYNDIASAQTLFGKLSLIQNTVIPLIGAQTDVYNSTSGAVNTLYGYANGMLSASNTIYQQGTANAASLAQVYSVSIANSTTLGQIQTKIPTFLTNNLLGTNLDIFNASTANNNNPFSYYAYLNNINAILGTTNDPITSLSLYGYLKNITKAVGASSTTSSTDLQSAIAALNTAVSNINSALGQAYTAPSQGSGGGGSAAAGGFFGSLFGGLAAIGSALGIAAGSDVAAAGLGAISSVGAQTVGSLTSQLTKDLATPAAGSFGNQLSKTLNTGLYDELVSERVSTLTGKGLSNAAATSAASSSNKSISQLLGDNLGDQVSSKTSSLGSALRQASTDANSSLQSNLVTKTATTTTSGAVKYQYSGLINEIMEDAVDNIIRTLEEEDLQAIEEDVDALKTELDSIKTEITSMDGKLDNIINLIDNLDSQISNNTSNTADAVSNLNMFSLPTNSRLITYIGRSNNLSFTLTNLPEYSLNLRAHQVRIISFKYTPMGDINSSEGMFIINDESSLEYNHSSEFKTTFLTDDLKYTEALAANVGLTNVVKYLEPEYSQGSASYIINKNEGGVPVSFNYTKSVLDLNFYDNEYKPYVFDKAYVITVLIAFS